MTKRYADTEHQIVTDTQHLESSRLFLRPIVDDDFAPFYARLVCDSVVMTFFHAYTRPMPDAVIF